MAFTLSIPMSVLASALKESFSTRTDNYERLVTEGQFVTLVVSDAPFAVPTKVGMANVLASKQITGPGLLLAEWLTRM